MILDVLKRTPKSEAKYAAGQPAWNRLFGGTDWPKPGQLLWEEEDDSESPPTHQPGR